MGPDAGGPSSVGMGVSKAIKDALTELHVSEKIVENTDQLLVSFQQVQVPLNCNFCFYTHFQCYMHRQHFATIFLHAKEY